MNRSNFLIVQSARRWYRVYGMFSGSLVNQWNWRQTMTGVYEDEMLFHAREDAEARKRELLACPEQVGMRDLSGLRVEEVTIFPVSQSTTGPETANDPSRCDGRT